MLVVGAAAMTTMRMMMTTTLMTMEKKSLISNNYSFGLKILLGPAYQTKIRSPYPFKLIAFYCSYFRCYRLHLSVRYLCRHHYNHSLSVFFKLLIAENIFFVQYS
jgi:hypothetical protein